MFRTLRLLSESLVRLVAVLNGIRTAMVLHADETAAGGNVLERVEALELSRARWEAEVEGVAMKASSTLKAARSAEERTRTMAGRTNGLDEVDSDGEAEILAAMEEYQLSLRDVDRGEEGELPAVRDPVEAGSKEAAQAVKFGWR